MYELGNPQNTRFWRKRSQKNSVPVGKKVQYPKVVHTFVAINYAGKSNVKFFLIPDPNNEDEKSFQSDSGIYIKNTH